MSQCVAIRCDALQGAASRHDDRSSIFDGVDFHAARVQDPHLNCGALRSCQAAGR